MLIIPAIDLKDNCCVRLKQGRMEEATVYSDDPVAMARRWAAAGARRLHIVDLNGAVSGQPVHADMVRRICDALPDIPMQVGGGIRDEDTIDAYLGAGVQYVILGSKAVAAPHFIADVCVEFPGHIMVGLDARNGKVATDGWSKLSHHDVTDMARQFERDGVESIVFTDIGRDGMLQGVNTASTVDLARAVHIPIIASGGIRSLDDIRSLCEFADEGIMGAITGTAIYEGTLDFAQAQQLADQLCGSDE
ncbi:MAG: 1-(5-phosphoribosyl)-5-[(5-phosphoribosylamino)methylideneamino]imidazole-4-carboxamide isomerase [Gammaproteobacteria bacterium]|nr:1-(5-phosphoribosyl)-5-[(5-phosphoribosylamino)methylideneamino]imidazole-4-carboxamide isomerase [Gammaproteobacteria bacterium]